MKTVLVLLGGFERGVCVAGFVIIAASLIADVLSRLITGAGLLGAPQVGVIGMIAVAMFGIGLAAEKGEHFRPRVFDSLWPDAWQGTIIRIGYLLTALFFTGLGVIGVWVVAESAQLGDVMRVIGWPIWPMQILIAAAFLLNALRYMIFAVDPATRPADGPQTLDIPDAD